MKTNGYFKLGRLSLGVFSSLFLFFSSTSNASSLSATVDAEARSPIVDSQLGSDLSADLHAYLYCDNLAPQKCTVTSIIPGAVIGSINETEYSKIELTEYQADSKDNTLGGKATTDLGGDSRQTFNNDSSDFITVQALEGTDVVMKLPYIEGGDSGDTIAGSDTFSTSGLAVNGMTFDDAVCFKSDTRADAYYVDGNSDGTKTGAAWTQANDDANENTVLHAIDKNSNTGEAVFFLSSTTEEFAIADIGQSDQFTISYTLTVTPNTTTDALVGGVACAAGG